MTNEIFQRKEIAPNNYSAVGAEGAVLKNHNNKPFPVLSDKMSKNLIDDLNQIFNKDRNSELNESLCYCVISTLMEYESTDMNIDLEPHIQWDRLFRLIPGPPYLLMELKNTEKAREFFGDNYVNLPINHFQTVEEMKDNEVSLVPETTINTVAELIKEMTVAQKITVHLLYNSYNHFSITLPVLWVTGVIDEKDFIAAYYALDNQTDIYEMTEEEYKEPHFEMNRLIYLKSLIDDYSDKDKTLTFNN